MLDVATIDGVRVVELSHGKVNALDLDLLHALTREFHEAGRDQPIVVTGAGRSFSAGVDLRQIVEGGPRYIGEFLTELSRCFLAIFDHPGPVVAAINGPAIAGGCVIAAACDVRLISAGPIGLAELAVGVPFPVAALEIVRGLLGARCQQLVLNARMLDPDEALAIGLVDEVTSRQSLRHGALERARTLASMPPGVFRLTKDQLRRPVRDRIAAAAAQESAMRELWSSPDVLAAIDAYLGQLAEKRARA